MNFNHTKKDDIGGRQQGSSEQKYCKEKSESLFTVRPVTLCFQDTELHIKLCLFMLCNSGECVFVPVCIMGLLPSCLGET